MTAKEEILELIAALRAEVEVESVSPERVGYLLQRMVGLLDEYAEQVEVDGLRQSLTNVTSRVTSCEDELSEHGEEIDTVKRVVSTLKRQVDINGDGLDTLASDFGLLQGSLREMAEQLETLAEVYCTEAEYQAMADAGTLDPDTKYFIYES